MPLMCHRSKLKDAESSPLRGLLFCHSADPVVALLSTPGLMLSRRFADSMHVSFNFFLAFPKFVEPLLLARNCSLSCKN